MRATVKPVSGSKSLGTAKKELDRKYAKDRWSKSEMPSDWVRDRTMEKYAYFELVPKRISSWNNAKFLADRRIPRSNMSRKGT